MTQRDFQLCLPSASRVRATERRPRYPSGRINRRRRSSVLHRTSRCNVKRSNGFRTFVVMAADNRPPSPNGRTNGTLTAVKKRMEQVVLCPRAERSRADITRQCGRALSRVSFCLQAREGGACVFVRGRGLKRRSPPPPCRPHAAFRGAPQK